MKVKVIGTTNYKEKMNKEDLIKFGGYLSAVCRSPYPIEEILAESEENTLKRADLTLKMGHHAAFDPAWINLYFEEIPKSIAMLLNNENFYATLEKSSRCTTMKVSEREEKLYNKWQKIIKSEIEKKYPCRAKDAENLGKENARYLTSIETPTTISYSTTLRQLNYYYGWACKLLEKKELNELEKRIVPYMVDFIKCLESTGYIVEDLVEDQKGREFSFIRDNHDLVEEYFGNVYSTLYKGTPAMLAQAHRHKTLDYVAAPLQSNEYYLLPILEDESMQEDYLADISSIDNVFPQGKLISINEYGNFEAFILKLKERLCKNAQLEINDRTKETLIKYINELKARNSVPSLAKADILEKYNKGARCTFPDYNCPKPCGINEAVTLTRKI